MLPRILASSTTATLAALLLPAAALAKADASKPAGGAAIEEIVIATVAAIVLTAALALAGWAYRAGRLPLLGRIADWASEKSGLPAWSALPSGIATVSLLGALFGMLWDISLHIDDGRDPGPLANPAHYFILAGLFGVFAAGFLALVLPRGKPTPSAVRIVGDWYAPLGGITMFACAGFALFGFPLDDVWHRLFGQDVTLWGPTHLMLIGGAGLSLIGHSMLLVEGSRAADEKGRAQGTLAKIARARLALVAGGLLIGLSVFQAEFDFGVPQFRMVFQPILIAVAAGIALVVARVYAGPGAALGAAVMWLAVRGVIALIVGPGLNEVLPYFPLYLAEAVLVELLAFVVSPRRAYRFGAIAGALIGTVGFAAEYAWSQVFMPMPWTSSLLGESLVVVPVAAVAAGLIGAYLGSALRAPRYPGEMRMPSLAPAAIGLVAIAVVVGYGLKTQTTGGMRATIALSEVTPAPQRTVNATIRVQPASAVRDPNWFNVLGWQGGQPMVLDRLRRVSPGTYRTTGPVPVHGTWKTMLRYQDGGRILAVPIFLPGDPAIPAREVPATATIQRPFQPDKQILQRELKPGVPASLWAVGYAVVGSISLALIVLMGWALSRLGASAAAPGGPRDRRRPSGVRPTAVHGGTA